MKCALLNKKYSDIVKVVFLSWFKWLNEQFFHILELCLTDQQ